MNTKVILASAAAAGILAIAAIAPVAAFAADTVNPAATFVQKLAAQLGIDQSTVQTAVDAVKTDMRTEREAQFQTEVAQAVTDGKLTQRQADILLAVQAARVDKERPAKPDVEPGSLTPEERKAQMEAMRTQHQQEMLDTLNASGLNTSADELEATMTAARSAGLRDGFGPHRRGPGGRMTM